MFLMGPMRQFKRMFKPVRRIATAVYLGMLVITVVVAFTLGHQDGGKIIVLICVFVQFCAAMWYTASYIPYGRKMLLSCLKSCGRSCVGE